MARTIPPYGTTLTNPIPNKDQAGFTGHIKDSATGLNYMQARYYDPLIGRFLSIDPVGFSVDSPQMFNRFSYTYNDPVNMLDPDGQHPAAAIWAVIVTNMVRKAGVGAIKGGLTSVGASVAVQKRNGNLSLKTTAVSGVKGALVGATHEVTGSGKATIGVAAAAGFIDGGATHLSKGGTLVGALGQGSLVGTADAIAAAGGVALPGKKGDLLGAASAVGVETAEVVL